MSGATEDTSNRHLERLIELLITHPTVVLSGERIASELHVSRSTVWRGMEELRRFGVRLRGHPAAGYQLEAAPDLLLASIVSPHLRSGAFGRRVHHFFDIPSTQDEAINAARSGDAHGTIFIAEEQTAGRGRMGHHWHSPPASGIYLSLLLRPVGPPAGMLPLNLGAGLALMEAIRDVCGLRADIRWPNDVLLSGKKVGGVLLEMSAEPTRIDYAVLGIGLNVNVAAFPDDLAPIATSLRIETGGVVSRVQLVVEILRHLELRYQQYSEAGINDLLHDFEHASSYARGLRVRVGADAGAFTGVTRGLDSFGFLLVQRDDGTIVTVTHGDVRPVTDYPGEPRPPS